MDKTIGDQFESVVQRFPDRSAVKTEHECWTYQQLNEESDAFALALQQNFNVKAGDRVGVSLGTNIAHFIVRRALPVVPLLIC